MIAQQNMKDWHGMFYADVYHTDEEWWARERNELARESELQPSCPNPTSTLLRPFASLTFSERDHIASPILRPRTPPLLPSIPAPSFQRRHHSHDDDFCILSLARTCLMQVTLATYRAERFSCTLCQRASDLYIS